MLPAPCLAACSFLSACSSLQYDGQIRPPDEDPESNREPTRRRKRHRAAGTSPVAGSITKSVGGRRLRGCRRRRQTCRRAGYSTYVVQMKWQTSILAVGALGCGRAPRLGMAPRAGLGACTRRAAERGHARPNLGHGCRPGAPRACPSPILERSGDVGRLRCGWGEVRPWTGPKWPQGGVLA